MSDSLSGVNVKPAQIDVLTIGHALVDVLAGADDEFLEAEGLSKGAMHLIDGNQAQSLYNRMGAGSETSGGSAANTAAGVVACGGTAGFIGTVAVDQLGEIFTHDLRSAGVRYRTVPIDTPVGTGRSMVLVTPDGERTMSTYIGASDQLNLNHLDPGWLSAASITYVEGYLLDDLHLQDAWHDVAGIVHAAGGKFSITLSDPFCVRRHRERFLDLLNGSVDICFGNAEELCELFQVSDLDVALDQISKSCDIAAITRGPHGSTLVSGDERVTVPAELVSVVDTTGAGDLYAAGVLAGLARGWNLSKSGWLGTRAASACVSRMGARPTHEQLALPAEE